MKTPKIEKRNILPSLEHNQVPLPLRRSSVLMAAQAMSLASVQTLAIPLVLRSCDDHSCDRICPDPLAAQPGTYFSNGHAC